MLAGAGLSWGEYMISTVANASSLRTCIARGSASEQRSEQTGHRKHQRLRTAAGRICESGSGPRVRNISIGLVSMDYNPHGYPKFSLREDKALRRAMVATMRERGISISLGEGFTVRPGLDVCKERAADLEVMCELGVKRINTVSMDPDLARTFDQFAALVELAAAADVEVTTELGPGIDGRGPADRVGSSPPCRAPQFPPADRHHAPRKIRLGSSGPRERSIRDSLVTSSSPTHRSLLDSRLLRRGDVRAHVAVDRRATATRRPSGAAARTAGRY